MASLTFGGTHDAVVYAVLSGKVDAGTVRTDTLERMALEKKISLKDVRVIPFTLPSKDIFIENFIQETEYKSFPYLFSTHLYPEWPFAKLSHTPDEIAKNVALALLAMPSDSEAATKAKIGGWTIPSQYQSVRICLKELRQWPYQEFGKITLRDVLRKYWVVITITFIGLLGFASLALVVLTLNKKLSKSTRALEQHKEKLEQRVAERTAELTKTNEALHQKYIEKQQDQEKLKKWANIFENAEWGIFVCDAENEKIELANPAFARMHGYSSEELIGKSCLQLFSEDELPKIHSHIQLANKAGHHTFETVNIKKDSSAFPVFMDVTVVPSSDDASRYHVVNMQDISQRKAAEKEKQRLESELQQAHKMEAIGTLAGGIAHDFNNILSVIIGFSEIIKLDIPVDSKVHAQIDQILLAAERAAALVKQILTFSRKSDQLQQTFEPHLIIKETLKMLRSSLPTTINIEEEIATDCGVINADPTKVHQIMLNLCTNSFHAMENTIGTLTVKLCKRDLTAQDIPDKKLQPGPYVELMVSDTGCGMNKEVLDRVFDPYFTTKDQGKGTGLGLSVVHGIVKDYKGFIKVDSNVGKGSTFKVYLPVQLEKQDIKSISSEEVYDTSGTERILVVDDEISIINLNKTVLERQGYTVVTVQDSLEALEIFNAAPDDFDLIITDQTMPNMSGSALASKILAVRPSLPIILCTGYSSSINEDEALALGISKYVNKPVERKELISIVREVLDRN